MSSESRICIHELFNRDMMYFDNDVEELIFDRLIEDEEFCVDFPSPFNMNSEGEEDNSFNHSEDNHRTSSNSFEELNVIEHISPSLNVIYPQTLSLSFINPPEKFYHVRYASEITDSPVNDAVVNNQIKTKKYISGRYLKGLRGRHVTIALPQMIFNCSNLYIRVTRLTVPYDSISYIHPYPMLYSSKKAKLHSNVIFKNSSIYFKVTKDELRSCSKQFPNIILTRLKQCDVHKSKNLSPFADDKNGTYHPFIGNGAKDKIARYNLKKSEIDFRIVNFCQETQEFIDTGISCRSDPLLEAEGVKMRK